MPSGVFTCCLRIGLSAEISQSKSVIDFHQQYTSSLFQALETTFLTAAERNEIISVTGFGIPTAPVTR
ncbi:hypothetical protein CC2G_002309 [Coprinopsis cinerea AmutBmut pab1-1]|nr:hypothetical protein CC2G_002309 [Coprinopsis cinerea AmutBmut pab1-1]